MKKNVVAAINLNQSKIAVLVDESTSLGARSVLTIHIRAHLGKGDPEFVFFDLLELNAQTAECVMESILHSLRLHFSEDFLKANWIAFISDEASVMLGKDTGVAARLRQYFPRLFIWHCLNHRLELAVSDAVEDVTAINHFKIFMDSIYCLYSMSSKNRRELTSICTDLDIACLQTGKILSVRWVASSFPHCSCSMAIISRAMFTL
jgi:hypothetical protein